MRKGGSEWTKKAAPNFECPRSTWTISYTSCPESSLSLWYIQSLASPIAYKVLEHWISSPSDDQIEQRHWSSVPLFFSPWIAWPSRRRGQVITWSVSTPAFLVAMVYLSATASQKKSSELEFLLRKNHQLHHCWSPSLGDSMRIVEYLFFQFRTSLSIDFERIGY
jgi:hypothetical protein